MRLVLSALDGREQPNGGHYYLLKSGDMFDLQWLAAESTADDREDLRQEFRGEPKEFQLEAPSSISIWCGSSPRLFFGSSPTFQVPFEQIDLRTCPKARDLT